MQVTQIEAGWLTYTSAERVRAMIAAGHLEATSSGLVDTGDLEALPDVRLDRALLREIRARDARTLEGLAAEIRATQRDTQRRLRAIERRLDTLEASRSS